jgi:citryl-CoA lyase
MAKDLTFTTQISGVTNQGLELRGKSLTNLIKEADFVASFFLSITGKIPQPAQTKLLNAVLVACIDQGLYPASGYVPRAVASSGNEVLTCMASSLLALGPAHGGAVTAAMKLYQDIEQMGQDREASCRRVIDDCLHQKKRLPGFGHPVYRESDPRTDQLFRLAREQEVDVTYIGIARTLESVLEEKVYKKLVINVDGAVAALLLTMGFPPASGNAVFGLARAAGCVAHVLEEQQSGAGVRRLRGEQVSYRPDA